MNVVVVTSDRPEITDPAFAYSADIPHARALAQGGNTLHVLEDVPSGDPELSALVSEALGAECTVDPEGLVFNVGEVVLVVICEAPAEEPLIEEPVEVVEEVIEEPEPEPVPVPTKKGKRGKAGKVVEPEPEPVVEEVIEVEETVETDVVEIEPTTPRVLTFGLLVRQE